MNKQILRLAIPNVISNLAIPLLGIVDTALVGHLDAIYFIGAVAIGSTLFSFIYCHKQINKCIEMMERSSEGIIYYTL